MNKILECKNLTMGYEGHIALKNLSFEVEQGDRLCIVGENGSGKSTLLKGLAGVMQPKSGSIEFAADIAKTDIGYLPQVTGIMRDFPACVCEVVLSGNMSRHGIFGRYSAQDRRRADEAIAQLGIEELHHRSFGSLSGGQKQRVLLARAMCAMQKVLLLDEPATGLDPIVAAEFYDELTVLADKGITVVMVSHDIPCAVAFANKILHLGTRGEFFGTTRDYLQSEVGKRFSGGEGLA